jgi:hypothetical protein
MVQVAWRHLDEIGVNSRRIATSLREQRGVITALTATSAGLAFGLSAPELGLSPLRLALAGAALTAALVAYEMLTKDGIIKSAATGLFVTAFITMLVLDIAA